MANNTNPVRSLYPDVKRNLHFLTSGLAGCARIGLNVVSRTHHEKTQRDTVPIQQYKALQSTRNTVTFSVCAMVHEEMATLDRFIHHYLSIGASEIRLYCDGALPNDAPGNLREEVTLIDCGPAFWKTLPEGGRPASLGDAQKACNRHAQANCLSDWILFTDADEFLINASSNGYTVRDFLSGVSKDVMAVRIPTAEAIWGPDDDPRRDYGCTYFRQPMHRRIARPLSALLYLNTSKFYRRGLLAHSAGKHFLRRTAVVDETGPHDSKYNGKRLGRWAYTLDPLARHFYSAHFDAVGFVRWKGKWRRRYSGETEARMHALRRAQMEMVRNAAASGDQDLRRLFERFYALKPWQARILQLCGLIIRTQVFPEHAHSSTVRSAPVMQHSTKDNCGAASSPET